MTFMPITMEGRLSVMEAKIDTHIEQNEKDFQEIKDDFKEVNINVSSLHEKLDLVVQGKADKEEVVALSNKMWYIAMAVIGMLVSAVGYFVTRYAFKG